jgi:hypothetical protein
MYSRNFFDLDGLLESANPCSWISGSAPLMVYIAQHRLRRSRLG